MLLVNPRPFALDPEPGPARDWLREELSRRDYQPTPAERLWQWVQDLLDTVRGASEAIGGFNPVVAALVLLVLVGLAALVLSRLRRNPVAGVATGAVFAEARLSAGNHRELAESALLRGDWDTVVVESTRALAVGLFERHLVREEVGITAHEITERAAQAFPDARSRLEQAARTFDETLYGQHPAVADEARAVVALEAELRSAPASTTTARGPVPAVPR